MKRDQLLLDVEEELFGDLFAGGGGASTGIERAIGRHVDFAINHDPEAVALHQANHPQTTHYVEDIFKVDPVAVCAGRPLGGIWMSPDCKHFSKAKGGKPVSKRIRGLAWVAVKWAQLVRPRVIWLENVEEFQHWGPLTADNMPCPRRKGRTFARWKRSLEALGYTVGFREDRASDFGAPTIRKRLFLVARCDGLPIVFPEPTHGAPDSLPVKAKKLKPHRTAAECIDFDLPCPSIFERDRELVDATKRRIARGIMRYVVDCADPFIVPLTHQGGDRTESIREPFRTVTGANRGERAIITPTLIAIDNQSSTGGAFAANAPLRTTTTENRHALVTAFLAQHNNHRGTEPSHGRPVVAPFSTVTSKGCQQQLVTSNLIKLRGTSRGAQSVQEPLHTISAGGLHHAEVRAFLLKYYGTDQDPRLTEPLHTLTTKARFGLVLVTIAGEQYAIVDIGMRMLTARELYRAQGFPESYIIDHVPDVMAMIRAGHRITHHQPRKYWLPLTKTSQVRMCGNSVSPQMAEAYVRANYRDRQLERRAA